MITTAHNESGESIPYILNDESLSPKYVIILFPGGKGDLDPHLEEGKLTYKFKANFLIRTRSLMVDQEFATAATNASQSTERILAIIDDLKKRFPAAQLYLMATSNGTYDTIEMAAFLSDKIAGEIHTSSLQRISFLDPRKYKNRHLVVHHLNDPCRYTPLFAAQASHDRYGTELIIMDGGVSVGDPCEPFSHHGFNGIEKETIDAIKAWIRKGTPKAS